MDRRAFNTVCTALLAGAVSLSRQGSANAGRYPVTRLLDQHQAALRVDSLAPGSCHIFNYPYLTTPCFLIRLLPPDAGQDAGTLEGSYLSDQAGNRYRWHGGAGPQRSLVAFSAICSHKMTHPARPVSHLNFRTAERNLPPAQGSRGLSQVIMCCSEHSVYDPADGARVLSGPAKQPLAAINLAVDSNGEISATGSYGGDMYAAFLDKFGFRLAMEAGLSDARTLVGDSTTAIPAQHYSRQQIRC